MTAVEAVNALLVDAEATQTAVDEAIALLSLAINNLETVQSETPDPEDPEAPG